MSLEAAEAAVRAAAVRTALEPAEVAAAEVVAEVVAVEAEVAVVEVTTNTEDSPGTRLPPPPSCTTPWARSAR